MRELPGLCDVPLAGRGCDLVMDAAQAVGDTVLEGIARELSAGFAEAAKLALASWTTVGLPDVSGPVGQMHSSLLWLTGSLAVLSLPGRCCSRGGAPTGRERCAWARARCLTGDRQQ